MAAWQLRMERIVNECARHLVSDLSIETCIETRSLPGINRNKTFVQDVDNYISQHVKYLFTIVAIWSLIFFSKDFNFEFHIIQKPP